MNNFEKLKFSKQENLRSTQQERKISPPESSVFNQEQTTIIKERTRELIEEIVDGDVELIVFLDRSARPLAWMLQEAWEEYAGGKAMPKIKFINMGREKGSITGWQSMEPSDWNYNSKEEWRTAVKDFWSKFESEEYVAKVRKDIQPILKKNRLNRHALFQKGGILLVDDYSVSGFTCELATSFFRHHFPEIPVSYYTFFKRWDEKTFGKAGWNGTHLPWSTDKAYTLMNEEEKPEKVTATSEHDPEKRKKGLVLKQEIKYIFRK